MLCLVNVCMEDGGGVSCGHKILTRKGYVKPFNRNPPGFTGVLGGCVWYEGA